MECVVRDAWCVTFKEKDWLSCKLLHLKCRSSVLDSRLLINSRTTHHASRTNKLPPENNHIALLKHRGHKGLEFFDLVGSQAVGSDFLRGNRHILNI